jgi:hypothetical protein
LDRRGLAAQEYGWHFARPMPAAGAGAASADGRMGDATGDETLCRAKAFTEREGARRSMR